MRDRRSDTAALGFETSSDTSTSVDPSLKMAVYSRVSSSVYVPEIRPDCLAKVM